MDKKSHEANDAHSSIGLSAIFWICILLYLVPIGVLLIDEAVLKNNWFAKHMPSWIGSAFQVAYYPLINFLKLLIP